MAYTKEIGIKDFYEYYKERAISRGRKPVSYSLYAKVLKDANLMLREAIIYRAETIQLPFRAGTLGIRKFEVAYNPDNIKSWKINFKATKEAGYVVYYGSKYGYKWFWNKKNAIVKGKRWYNFKPCRANSRLIADAVNNKELDYYTHTFKNKTA